MLRLDLSGQQFYCLLWCALILEVWRYILFYRIHHNTVIALSFLMSTQGLQEVQRQIPHHGWKRWLELGIPQPRVWVFRPAPWPLPSEWWEVVGRRTGGHLEEGKIFTWRHKMEALSAILAFYVHYQNYNRSMGHFNATHDEIFL